MADAECTDEANHSFDADADADVDADADSDADADADGDGDAWSSDGDIGPKDNSPSRYSGDNIRDTDKGAYRDDGVGVAVAAAVGAVDVAVAADVDVNVDG
jgi:hypothetical protein